MTTAPFEPAADPAINPGGPDAPDPVAPGEPTEPTGPDEEESIAT